MKEVTESKLIQYSDITKKALAQVKEAVEKDNKKAATVLDMATRYFNDAQHFREKGDFVNAFACLNYAHGWLDAGAMLKLYDVDDSSLFTVE